MSIFPCTKLREMLQDETIKTWIVTLQQLAKEYGSESTINILSEDEYCPIEVEIITSLDMTDPWVALGKLSFTSDFAEETLMNQVRELKLNLDNIDSDDWVSVGQAVSNRLKQLTDLGMFSKPEPKRRSTGKAPKAKLPVKTKKRLIIKPGKKGPRS